MALNKGSGSIPGLQSKLKTKPESYWIKRGEVMVMRLFHEMAERVPAYADFLDSYSIDHKKVKTVTDLKQVPAVDKDNYLRKYTRSELCWDGQFDNKNWVISATSGSSGEPFYFPRQVVQDKQYADAAELYLRENFRIQDKSTLYIVAFPMGAWIGGVFTYQALQMVASRGYNLSVITPGVHKEEVVAAFKSLAGEFDQVIIGSYGPFLKDILDDGIKAGIDWKSYSLGFVFSAEVVTEKFREYVARKTGIDIITGSLNHYGTVDMGTMAHETPLSVLVRRKALEDESLYKELFDDVNKLPTLAQYLPEMFYFEADGPNLYCSAYSGIPLVRYDLKDHGGLLSRSEVFEICQRNGVDLGACLEETDRQDLVWNLPFVHVYERSDFSVSFFAFQIYPETIRRTLQSEEFEYAISGKFTMEVDYDDKGRQKFKVNVELASGQDGSDELANRLEEAIASQLLKESSEYREVYGHYGKEIYPVIIFWRYGDPAYFKSGAKQIWAKKNVGADHPQAAGKK